MATPLARRNRPWSDAPADEDSRAVMVALRCTGSDHLSGPVHTMLTSLAYSQVASDSPVPHRPESEHPWRVRWRTGRLGLARFSWVATTK